MTNYVPELQQYRTVRRWMEDGRDLQALLLAEEITAAAYIQLARRVPGREAARLQQLARESHAHAACLEGICVLVTGEAPVTRTPAPESGTTGSLLRKCYGRAMRTLAVYEARREDPEYGPVFARMAARQQDHCRTILELIGSIGNA